MKIQQNYDFYVYIAKINNITMKRVLYPLAFLMVLLAACTGSKQVVKTENKSNQKRQMEFVQFYSGGTLTEIIDRAKKEDKLVFIDITAEWCAPCKLMEQEIYTYKPLYEKMNQRFVSYQVDIEKGIGPNLSVLYDTKTVPTLLFLDTRGRVLAKNKGALGIQEMLDLVDKVSVKK